MHALNRIYSLIISKVMDNDLHKLYNVDPMATANVFGVEFVNVNTNTINFVITIFSHTKKDILGIF